MSCAIQAQLYSFLWCTCTGHETNPKTDCFFHFRLKILEVLYSCFPGVPGGVLLRSVLLSAHSEQCFRFSRWRLFSHFKIWDFIRSCVGQWYYSEGGANYLCYYYESLIISTISGSNDSDAIWSLSASSPGVGRISVCFLSGKPELQRFNFVISLAAGLLLLALGVCHETQDQEVHYMMLHLSSLLSYRKVNQRLRGWRLSFVYFFPFWLLWQYF